MADENTTPEVDDVKVDESSIARPDIARRNTLDKQLAHRPDRAELIEKNILPASSAAPGLLAQQKELQKHMRADSLNEKIAHRPSPDELIKKGVLNPNEDPRSPEQK
ncbi:MKL/myocardin-like protein 2 [Cytospora mali]|uniref:MKL/myocardin-like protein 2 n=1 Tax=Cytospora mali TaxID=578113 RepID=A0A194W3U0_CYTMA|nr:MKL/myocardin-like protein 2 [Valsa mali]